MNSSRKLLLVLMLAAAMGLAVVADSRRSAADREDSSDEPRSVAEATRDMEPREGLLRFFVDRDAGKIWLEVPPPDGPRDTAIEMLYVEGLRTGLGSNPVGLDRGQLGATRWVALRRIGPRVLVEQRNPDYRAITDDADERRAARESFATSVLWATDATAVDPDGTALVDFTSFLVRDAHRVSAQLKERGQGNFQLDTDRSVPELDECRAFPDNLELEALLTYAGENPGREVRSTAPAPESITLIQHHSLIRLPDDGYRPRRSDPRAGTFGIEFQDYAAGLAEPIRDGFIARHRIGDDPLVFYVDRGAPEPIRSALLDGAGWWSEAFDDAGLPGAFRVALLPEDAHPLDVRYNVIQWVHRATRGWSYGGAVTDPRTGEMIKGHVTLGSLRVRQDRLLFEGLAGTAKTGSGDPDDPIQLALARIRQLAAHEVGHALGLAHNFAASTYDDRASVMDYPAPRIRIGEDGELDFSEAYGVGVGSWDRQAIRYAYGSPRGSESEREFLERVLQEGVAAGRIYLTDADARPPSAAEPRANLWDNGSDPVAELTGTLAVRRHALERFGPDNLLPGQPLAHLEELLGPVYFHHRYQLDAALKVVGGMEYDYEVRGDQPGTVRIVPSARQRRALETVLSILDVRELDLPDGLVDQLLPRPGGESRNREMFATRTRPAFDLQGAAATAAAAVIDGLLQTERLGRLAEFHRRDPRALGVDELLSRLSARTLQMPGQRRARGAEIARLVQSVLVERLIALARDPELRPTLRARVEAALRRMRKSFQDVTTSELDRYRHARAMRDQIDRFLNRSESTREGAGWRPDAPPPGSPIGTDPAHGCGWFTDRVSRASSRR